MSEILLKGSQRKVNEEQAKAIPAQILQGWEELTKKGKALIIQKEQTETYVQDVFNRYDLGKKGLDIEEQKLVKDIVLGMLEIASKYLWNVRKEINNAVASHLYPKKGRLTLNYWI